MGYAGGSAGGSTTSSGKDYNSPGSAVVNVSLVPPDPVKGVYTGERVRSIVVARVGAVVNGESYRAFVLRMRALYAANRA